MEHFPRPRALHVKHEPLRRIFERNIPGHFSYLGNPGNRPTAGGFQVQLTDKFGSAKFPEYFHGNIWFARLYLAVETTCLLHAEPKKISIYKCLLRVGTHIFGSEIAT